MTSIATKTGDDGTTGLLFNRRVSKSDPRVEANGWLDELNIRLGQVIAELDPNDQEGKVWVQEIQKNLVLLMGCVALAPEDYERYDQSTIHKPQADLLMQVEKRIEKLESKGIQFEKWSHPETRLTTAWHLARTGTRHAERSVQGLKEKNLLHPSYEALLIQVLNRLSDLFWLEAKLLSDKMTA